MNWRQQQLSRFDDNVIIRQDQDLVDYIKNNNIQQASGSGAVGYFSNFVQFVKGPSDFYMCIINEPFDFLEMIDDINMIIKNHINVNGMLYLALNKFYANPICYSSDLSSNYDIAIYQFVKEKVHGSIKLFLHNENDDGTYFNFAHPITRFYIQKTA